MHNIYLNVFFIISTPTCFNAPASSSGSLNLLIIPAYRKHQHGDYTHTTVQIVYAATKHTTYMCFTDCILSLNNDHLNILMY